ncbi:MAG: hypothetical protein ABJB86_07610 [Bacteroidota bacterium]
MKKIFTLLFAVGIVGFASAQSRNFDHGKKDNDYSFNEKKPATQTVNLGYDYRIFSDKREAYMSPWEREKQMRYMEEQRRLEKHRHEYQRRKFEKSNAHRW